MGAHRGRRLLTGPLPLVVSDPVEEAIGGGRPVVALESTVIAHGLPYPRNVEVARGLERLVSEAGSVPATIGIVDGVVRIGLDARGIDRLAADPGVLKASVRDLGAVVAAGRSAATTVAATATLAARACIGVFATGGIGGVHRGGEASLDVSADLEVLARVPVAVVCAGAKAILDLPRTLERLETLGVPVLGLRTSEFPAFYSHESGLRLEHRVEDETAAARAIAAHRAIVPASGCLVCNPPPADREISPSEVAAWVERADSDAREAGVSGKALTPWLLSRLAELSGGRTVEANVALLESNARAAAGIARALAAAA